MSPPHDQPYQGWANTSGRDSATSDGEHEDVEPIEFGEGQFEDEDEEVDSGTRVEEVEIFESKCV